MDCANQKDIYSILYVYGNTYFVPGHVMQAKDPSKDTTARFSNSIEVLETVEAQCGRVL